jgi:hypothetical protein
MWMVVFSSTEDIDPDELDSIRPIWMHLAWAMALTNDLFSWDKECQDYLAQGCTGQLLSAVKLLMRLKGIDEDQAKKDIVAEVLKLEQHYVEAKDEYIKQGHACPKLVHYLNLLELAHAGNWVWHTSSPRYHRKTPTVELGGNDKAVLFESFAFSTLSEQPQQNPQVCVIRPSLKT